MTPRHAPWWLTGGTEQCPFCLERYALEVEVRCVACDRGLCAHCLARVRLREEAWCPACAAAEAGRGG